MPHAGLREGVSILSKQADFSGASLQSIAMRCFSYRAAILDISCVASGRGSLYLIVVLHLLHRCIAGWSMYMPSDATRAAA
jgi:hypothetical protein